MKPYDELKVEMEAIQHKMVEARRGKRVYVLKELKRVCKEIGLLLGC